MGRCPHNNVQQFTEICLDCGRNIYESDDEYLKHLQSLKANKVAKAKSDEIERLEKELGITRNGKKQCDDKCGSMMCSCGGHCQVW